MSLDGVSVDPIKVQKAQACSECKGSKTVSGSSKLLSLVYS